VPYKAHGLDTKGQGGKTSGPTPFNTEVLRRGSPEALIWGRRATGRKKKGAGGGTYENCRGRGCGGGMYHFPPTGYRQAILGGKSGLHVHVGGGGQRLHTWKGRRGVDKTR